RSLEHDAWLVLVYLETVRRGVCSRKSAASQISSWRTTSSRAGAFSGGVLPLLRSLVTISRLRPYNDLALRQCSRRSASESVSLDPSRAYTAPDCAYDAANVACVSTL